MKVSKPTPARKGKTDGDKQRRQRRTGKPKLTPAQVVEHYQSGMSLREVGIAAGIGASTVMDWLDKARVKRRSPGRPVGTANPASLERHKHWAKLRKAGWRWADIARDQGVTHPAVMKAVAKLERSSGDASQ